MSHHMQVMHRGFDLPNAEFNGKHRIDIRLYARTPIGAKNMVVDEAGSRFRQFDMAVDGLSYFSMPAVFELGKYQTHVLLTDGCIQS